MTASNQELHSDSHSEGDTHSAHDPHVTDAAEKAHQAMLALVEAVTHESMGRHCAAEELEALSLTWAAANSPADLSDSVLQAVSECISEVHVFETGRVYCYACGSADCSHASPPQAGDVFSGYASTGKPEWQEFFRYLLALQDDRTDRLFADRPDLLARVVGRKRLIWDQLASFGRNSLTYRIWGQVVAGHLAIHDTRAALTLQVVEDNSHHLHLQVIADTLVREALANAPDDGRSSFHRVYDAIAEARRQISSLSSVWHNQKRTRKDAAAMRNNVFSVLRHLAHSIERKGRQQHRRTRHAEVRSQQKRPVHKAYDDLVAAGSKDIFLDRMKQSIIVVGRSGRIHAFNRDGKHITSLVLGRGELERRISRRRYTPYSEEEAESFRANALATLPETDADAS